MAIALTVARAGGKVLSGYEHGGVWIPFIERGISDSPILLLDSIESSLDNYLIGIGALVNPVETDPVRDSLITIGITKIGHGHS